MRTVWILTNPAAGAGRGLGIGEEVVADVRRRGLTVEVLQPSSVAEIGTVLWHALAEGMDHLLLVGGDGLVHQALSGLAGADITVGIVASGTGNDFAKALGLPSKRSAAIDVALATGVGSEKVDLIRATAEAEADVGVEADPNRPSEDRSALAATVVTGGFSGKVNARADKMTFPKGSSRYTVATLIELAALVPIELELIIDDGDSMAFDASFFAVANTRYFGGGMAICPEASPFDGLLDVTIVGQSSAFSLARMLPTVFFGRHIRHRAVSVYRGRSVRLTTSAPIWADGEPFLANSHEENALRSVSFSSERSGIRINGAKKAL